MKRHPNTLAQVKFNGERWSFVKVNTPSVAKIIAAEKWQYESINSIGRFIR